MICVTVARSSRRLTLAGMVNAARMSADLVEVRLDTIDQEPDLGELVAARRTPLMLSCRRAEEGGNYQGTEEDRLMLLRRAVLAGPEYIAIEHDIAEQIPPHGSTKRVICYTNTSETPANIDAICGQCHAQNPDVIQIMCRVRTAEDAWPLLKLLKNPPAPLVVVGLGWPGILLSLLGREHGSPWVTAAIERGAESYPGQPTVRELVNVYRYPEINRETSWIGVTGLGPWEQLTIALLNAAFAAQGSWKRCLPVQVGDPSRFRKFAERLKLKGVVINSKDQEALASVAAEFDEEVRFASWSENAEELVAPVDVLVQPEPKQWQGGSIFPRAALGALRSTLRQHEKSLDGASVLFVGLTPATIGLARGVKRRNGRVIFADRDAQAAQRFSQWFGGRHVRFEAVYSTLTDVLILGADPGIDPDDELAEPMLKPNCLREGMTVMDLTGLPKKTPFLIEAAHRGCHWVEPIEILYQYVQRLVYRLRGDDVPREVLHQAINSLLADALISATDFPPPPVPVDSPPPGG